MQSQTNRGTTTGKNSSVASQNPFARALAEAEKLASQNGNQSNSTSEPGFPGLDGLGGFNQFGGQKFDQASLLQEQQEKAKKERMRRQLHEQINPVDSTKLFDARQKQVKEEIDKLRYELKALSQEVRAFNKEIELTLMTEVGLHPGMEGKYYINFFQQLRAFIMLLRQKIRSARTWASAAGQKKKKKMVGAGIVIDGAAHEQTKSVYDMMHHERSNAYGG
jgi:hypothetical protein